MKSKKSTILRSTAILCAVSISSGLALGGCAKKDVQNDIVSVEVAAPTAGSIELMGSFVGTVEAENEVEVVAMAAGDVTAVYFDEGDRVKEGDLLFAVDDRDAQLSLAQAQAELDSASVAVSAAKLDLSYTEEQINENFGVASTSAMQLENAVASADYTSNAAKQSLAFAEQNYDLEEKQFKELEESLENAGTRRDEYTAEADKLAGYARNYSSLKNAGGVCSDTGSDLYRVMTELGLAQTEMGLADGANGGEVADKYLQLYTEFRDIYTIGVAENSFRAAAALEDQARIQAQEGIDSASLALFDTAIRLEQAKDHVDESENAKSLAEKMLADFNTYTIATIQMGAKADYEGTKSKLAQAQANEKEAEKKLDAAQLQVEYTQGKAPVSGVILQKNVSVNNRAEQGTVAYVIAGDNGYNAVFYVAENVMRELAVGQKVIVERNGSTYDAVISSNAGVADLESGLFEVKARLKNGLDTLVAGTGVKVTLVTQSEDSVLTVPVDCVYYENREAFVYCMVDGKAVKTLIETGIADNEKVEVKSGLTKESQVITTWTSRLKDGLEVEVKGGADE